MEWIFAYNIKYYDLDRAIHELDGIDWLSENKVEVGDTVYLYSSKPEQFIKYKCIVTEAGKTRTTHDETPYGGTEKGLFRNCFEIKLVYEFKEPITIAELAKYGLSTKRVPTISSKTKPSVFEYIRERELQENQPKLNNTVVINDDINLPKTPANIEIVGNTTYVTCLNCRNKFIKARRCPECGQLQKYED